MRFKSYLEESKDTIIKDIYHGGRKGLDNLDVEKTKSLIFGKAIYFTDSLESAKQYAWDRYGADGQVYQATITMKSISNNAIQFRNNAKFDGLVFALTSIKGETNYAVKSNKQVLSLKEVK
jgi:hypothetical protein